MNIITVIWSFIKYYTCNVSRAVFHEHCYTCLFAHAAEFSPSRNCHFHLITSQFMFFDCSDESLAYYTIV